MPTAGVNHHQWEPAPGTNVIVNHLQRLQKCILAQCQTDIIIRLHGWPIFTELQDPHNVVLLCILPIRQLTNHSISGVYACKLCSQTFFTDGKPITWPVYYYCNFHFSFFGQLNAIISVSFIRLNFKNRHTISHIKIKSYWHS